METEIGPKMRIAFEATLPDDRAILDRYDPARLKAPPVVALRRWAGVGAGALLAAAGVLLAWSLRVERPIAIEPSLERDLQARSSSRPKEEQRGDAERITPGAAPERMGPDRRETARENTALAPKPSDESTGTDGQAETSSMGGVATPAESSWARVTEAMRRRDWPAAQEALAPLLASTDRETRDSARLVRLRLELGSAQPGVRDGLLAELEELAKSGSTSSIRASARRLHKSLLDGESKQVVGDESKLPLPEGELPLKEEE